jgi:anti-anti-sigma factor
VLGVSDSTKDFQIKWHSGTLIVVPGGDIESMKWDLIEQAAEVVMGPLEETDVPLVIFDLSAVDYFGSVFLSLMLRCHKAVKPKGGELVLCGASPMASELLQVTALDTLWAIYSTREEAIEALAG